ncbi:uncharacterized protein BX663DRAFT_320855 [Cokeromyces recurvatus]|uniref:uncharacterized protein n=1 Tax=Cokeromyces recurvatus TaxID=90255 RepID=UPI00221F71B3|nr:uncharacterized protein BX663DRAFT_320855 [Cokeromyces recurvatus]KAI7904555.1 hypothetical protein BX663DRAFT_320855 [Cokeromyces recurvatus]
MIKITLLLSLSIINIIISGLQAAYINDGNRHNNDYQIAFKTPLGVPYRGRFITIDKRILNTEDLPFIEHSDGNSSWLAMNFDFQYVKPIFDFLNTTHKVPLLSRGEAHITVISPPEFTVLATAGVTIDDLNKIAISDTIQKSKVEIICIGKEDVVIENKNRIVYQIIVKSSDLIGIRKKIFQLYARKDGNTALFDPNVQDNNNNKESTHVYINPFCFMIIIVILASYYSWLYFNRRVS